MKHLILALVFVVPSLSFAAKAKPKTLICKGTYDNGYRKIEADGKGFCYMAFDGMSFSGTCEQQKDGSVTLYIAGNSFSGSYSADCSELKLSGLTYKRQP